jgi:hypothetical protein
MRTIETTATVSDDRVLTVKVPSDVPPGEHKVVVVIDEEAVEKRTRPLLDFPVISMGSWPDDLSLRREDMYGEDGR